MVRAARAPRPFGPRPRLRRTLVPAAPEWNRNLLVSGRDRPQGAQAIPRPGAARRRSRPRQDHRGRYGPQGVPAARHGGARVGADAGIPGRTMAGRGLGPIRYFVRHPPRRAAAPPPPSVLATKTRDRLDPARAPR